MPEIRQNFSIPLGDDIQVSLDIDPDVASLIGTNLTLRVYDQDSGVSIGDALITKNLDDGLQITDPDYGLVLIDFASDDTIDLDPRNYNFEITTYDGDGNRTTVTYGTMTGTRTKNPQTAAEL